MQGRCIAKLMRIGLFVVAMAAIMCALPLRTPLALADEEQQPTGYWKLVDVTVEKEEDVRDDRVYTNIYTANPGNHQAEYSGLILETDTKESASFVATCSPPPDTVPAGGDVVLQLSLTMTTQSCEHFHFRERAAVHRDDPGMGMSGVHRGYVDFVATQEDAPDSCSMWAIGDWGSDPDWVPSAEVHGIMPTSGSDSRRCIYFRACGAQTAWTYEWVEGDIGLATTDEEEDVFYAQVNQDEHDAASDTPGESGSKGIIPSIIEGFDPSEGGRYAVIGAAALVIIGGVTYLRYRRRRNKDAKPEEKKQEPRSAYRMLVYKDFGGELRAGDAPREVCARIEEIIGGYADPGNVLGAAVPGTAVAPGAKTRQRDDLTQEIKATGEAGLQVVGTSFNGKYLVARVQVPRQGGAPIDPNRRPTVVFTYTNPAKAGTFTQRVAFKLAAEPQIVFVGKGGDGSYSCALGSSRIGLLLADAQGSPICFEAANFIKAPTHVEVKGSDARVSGKGERCVDAKRPSAFVYQVAIKNSLPSDSIYGTWPMEMKLTVSAWNDDGERAEAEASAFLWPEGIFVDTRQVRKERVFKDHLLMDTSDILLSAGAEYNIEGATVEVGAAFKDDRGTVIVDMPTEPGDGSYLKLKAAGDSLSQKAFDPKSSRIWYTLGYVWHPTYSEAHEPLGTLQLTPLMPLVSKRESDESRGSVPIRYSKGGRQAQADVVFALKGLGSDQYDADLKTERDRIYRLLAAYKPDDWSRIDAVLAKYGRQAEEDQQRLGTAAQRDEAGQTAIQLVKSVAHIQSLQRMRAVRKMVYEAAEVTHVHEKVEADSEASLYNGLYLAANTVRWFDDIAFSVWWTALCGPGAAAFVEPLMTPLKDWIVGFLEILGLCAFDDEANIPPDDYFTLEGFEKEVLQKQLDGELMGILMGNTVPTPGSFSWKRLLFGMGATVCYLFYRNCSSGQFSKVNAQTGTTEFDFWGALKATTVDLSIFSIKGLLSYFIARKASSKMTEVKEASLFNVDEADGPFDKFCVKAAKWFVEDPLKAVSDAVETTAERVSGSVGEVIVGNAAVEVVQTAVDGVQSSLVDLIRDQSPDSMAAAQSADQWARGFGEVTVELKDDEGHPLMGLDNKPRTLVVPLLSVVALYVDHVLKELGLDIKVDFRGVVPDEPGYTTHDQLVAELEGIDKASWEVSFLRNPASLGAGSQDPYLPGAERPTFDTGVDFHRYMK